MESIYSELLRIEQNGIPAALCTIIESSGSTPRKEGTKMIVYPDRSIFGTIGGGALEMLVIEDAIENIQTNQSTIKSYHLKQDLEMTCGGMARVFIEPIVIKSRLFIFGAGHIGSFLAKLAQMLNFSVTLIDEREGIFKPNIPSDVAQINEPYADAIQNISFTTKDFVCVVTHNHENDKQIIAKLAKKELAYIGMIGSKNKVSAISKQFLEEGVLSQDEINQIDWPMGIPINCQTPEEIAVSILAKLVDVRSPKKHNK